MPTKRKLRLRVDANLVDPFFIESLKSLKNVRVGTVKGQAVPDEEILVKANTDDYHIITGNSSDFFRLFKKQTLKVGVIGINTKVSLKTITPKVVRLLKLLGHKDVYHKFYEVNNAGCRVYHRRTTESKFASWRNIENVFSN